MTLLAIKIDTGDKEESIEIKDYVHDESHQCKFEVFKDGEFVASFEPGSHGHLYVCKNSGKLDNELLHQLAEKLEAYQI